MNDTADTATVQPGAVDVRPDPDSWQALGQFVEECAIVETLLFHYLLHITNLHTEVARGVFAEMCPEQMIQHIGRIWQIRSPPDALKTELDPVFTQLKGISGVRNNLVHHASITTSHGRMSTNMGRALTPEGIAEHRVSAACLKDMSVDLQKIGAHLFSLVLDSPASSLKERAAKWKFLDDAWRWKGVR